MKKSILLVLILITSVTFAQEEKVEVPKIAVKVPMGETVLLGDVSIKFIKVLEDSRCPKDVTCVWAGQAKVLVEVSVSGKESKQVELLFGGKKDNILYSSEEKVLKGIALSPYPTSDTAGKLNYVLLVSEEKKE